MSEKDTILNLENNNTNILENEEGNAEFEIDVPKVIKNSFIGNVGYGESQSPKSNPIADESPASASTPAISKPPKKKKKVFVVVAVIVVLALVLGIVGAIFAEEYGAYETSDGTENYTWGSVGVVSVEGSSYMDEGYVVHYPEKVYDGDTSTAWVEDVYGFGIDEYITLNLDGDYLISEIEIYAGHHKDSELYVRNCRPCELEISFSDGSSETHYLDDVMQAQYIILDTPVVTNEVTITIKDSYAGSHYEDTCISEIDFCGYYVG